MTILFAGDVHGNLQGLTRWIQKWQRKNRMLIDHVVQVGDMGFDSYPKPREEEMIRMLSEDLWSNNPYDPKKKIGASLYFVYGNHDDICAKKIGRQIGVHPVSERVFQFEGPLELDGKILFGLGGIAKEIRSKQHYVFYEEEHFDLYLEQQVRPDILVTHQNPSYAFIGNKGCEDLSSLVALSPPRMMHVWGHHNRYVNKEFQVGGEIIQGVGLKRVDGLNSVDSFFVL